MHSCSRLVIQFCVAFVPSHPLLLCAANGGIREQSTELIAAAACRPGAVSMALPRPAFREIVAQSEDCLVLLAVDASADGLGGTSLTVTALERVQE